MYTLGDFVEMKKPARLCDKRNRQEGKSLGNYATWCRHKKLSVAIVIMWS